MLLKTKTNSDFFDHTSSTSEDTTCWKAGGLARSQLTGLGIPGPRNLSSAHLHGAGRHEPQQLVQQLKALQFLMRPES